MITVKIYDRELNITQIANVLNQLDDDMLYDLAQSINEQMSNKDTVKILRQLYVSMPDSRQVHKLYEMFGVTPNQIVGNTKSSDKKDTSKKKEKKTHEHDFDGGLQHVENFKPSESPTVLPGVAYKTNREKRELCEITDVPSVNFDMPTVPDLPKLD